MTHSQLTTQQQNIVRICPSDSVKGDGTAATNALSLVRISKWNGWMDGQSGAS